jgi:hypothetical protein
MKAPPPVETTRGTAPQQPLDDTGLQRPELHLAVGGEEFADGHARNLFDLRIRVDEGNGKGLRHQPADRRFAGPHQPDEDQVALAEDGARLFAEWSCDFCHCQVHFEKRYRQMHRQRQAVATLKECGGLFVLADM